MAPAGGIFVFGISARSRAAYLFGSVEDMFFFFPSFCWTAFFTSAGFGRSFQQQAADGRWDGTQGLPPRGIMVSVVDVSVVFFCVRAVTQEVLLYAWCVSPSRGTGVLIDWLVCQHDHLGSTLLAEPQPFLPKSQPRGAGCCSSDDDGSLVLSFPFDSKPPWAHCCVAHARENHPTTG